MHPSGTHEHLPCTSERPCTIEPIRHTHERCHPSAKQPRAHQRAIQQRKLIFPLAPHLFGFPAADGHDTLQSEPPGPWLDKFAANHADSEVFTGVFTSCRCTTRLALIRSSLASGSFAAPYTPRFLGLFTSCRAGRDWAVRSAKDFTVQLTIDADAPLHQVKQQLKAAQQALALRESKQCKLVIDCGAQWAISSSRILQLLPRYLRGAGASVTHLVLKAPIGELVYTAVRTSFRQVPNLGIEGSDWPHARVKHSIAPVWQRTSKATMNIDAYMTCVGSDRLLADTHNQQGIDAYSEFLRAAAHLLPNPNQLSLQCWPVVLPPPKKLPRLRTLCLVVAEHFHGATDVHFASVSVYLPQLTSLDVDLVEAEVVHTHDVIYMPWQTLLKASTTSQTLTRFTGNASLCERLLGEHQACVRAP